MATATALTVETIADAYEGLLPGRVDEAYVSGRGSRNRHLMRLLGERMAPTPVYDHGDLGIPAEAKEAVLMAVLANEHIHGKPSNIPRVTGARRAVSLESLHLP